MKKIGKKELILSLLEGIRNESITADEFTLADYVDAARESGNSIPERRALKLLADMCKNGTLEKRKALHQGRYVNAYRKP